MTSENQSSSPTQWVFIRGLARESRHWGEFLPTLETQLKLKGESVYLDPIDLPGTGRYSEMKSPISISEITEFARDKMHEIRSRRRDAGQAPARATYLVAVSLGGMVATRWLERWPDDFAGCVLINTSFRGLSPVHRRLRPMSLVYMANAIKEKNAFERERHILRMISNRPERIDEIAKEWAQVQVTRPVTLENFTRQLIAAARFESHLEHAPIPVLLLNSDRDRMVHPSCSHAIAERWGAELHCHPTAGHDLSLDEPEWVAQKIAGWYRGKAK